MRRVGGGSGRRVGGGSGRRVKRRGERGDRAAGSLSLGGLRRPTVGRLSFPGLRRSTVERHSLCRPTVGRRSLRHPTVGRHRPVCRPTVRLRSLEPCVAQREGDLGLRRCFVGRFSLCRSLVGRQGNILDILLNAVIFLIFRKKLLLFLKKIPYSKPCHDKYIAAPRAA